MVNNIKYYSQAGQDAWVLKTLNFKTNGFFIDIGAYDGIEISNTYALEKLGWKGICIEAGEKNFELLLNNRLCTCINTVISNYNGICYFNENDKYGSIVKEGKKRFCHTIEFILDLQKAPNEIDYLSIDIEGGELNLLKTFPFDKYIVDMITVEHNAYNRGTADKELIYDLLTKHGYERFKEVSADGLHFEDWYQLIH